MGNERAKPLAFPPIRKRGRSGSLSRNAEQANGTLARRDDDGRCGGKQSEDKAVAPTAQRRQSKRGRGRRSHGKERGKSASGSAQRLRTLKECSGKECDY